MTRHRCCRVVSRRLPRVLTLLVVLLLRPAAGGLASEPPRPPDVLLIVLDTLRADFVGKNQDGSTLTPFLDSLAARSTVYRRAYSTTSWTLPSVVTMWTSEHQLEHGVTEFIVKLDSKVPTLAATLAASGWATAGFSANPILRRDLGITRGFDEWTFVRPGGLDEAAGDTPPDDGELLVKTRAPEVNDAALNWIDTTTRKATVRRPFFVHLQFMEAHRPYGPPPDLLLEEMARSGNFDAKLDALLLRPAAATLRTLDPRTREVLTQISESQLLCPAADPGELLAAMQAAGSARCHALEADIQRDHYAAEVRSLDRDLAALFAALDARGLTGDLAVIVTADHGEELQDHGRSGHGYSLYEEVVRVPLLVHSPGQRARVDISEPVSLLDLAPTILDIAGVAPPSSFRGRRLPGVRSSRAEASPGDGWPTQQAYMDLPARPSEPPHLAHRRGLVVGTTKILEPAHGTNPSLYDLKSDPQERRPSELTAAGKDSLRAAFSAAIERSAPARGPDAAGSPAPEATLDPQTRARLRALGYVP